MDSKSVDYVELLKKAEDEAALELETARAEAARRLAKAHGRASSILDDAGRNASHAKHDLILASRAQIAAESEALLAQGRWGSQSISSRPIDGAVVTKCLTDFLGGLGV